MSSRISPHAVDEQRALRARLDVIEAEAKQLRAQLGGGLPGAGFDRIEAVERLAVDGRFAASGDVLGQMFADAPAAIAILVGPDHRFLLSNRLHDEWTGGRVVLGESVARLFPAAQPAGFIDLLDRVLRTGESLSAQEAPLLSDPTRYTNFYYRRLQGFGEGSGGYGVLALGVDVTAQVVARKRAQAIAAVAQALSDATSPRAVADVLVQRAHDVLDAAGTVVLFAADEDSRSASLVASRGLPAARMARYQPMPLDAQTPLADAMRTDQPVLIETRAKLVAAYPELAESPVAADQLQAVAAIPLRQRGRVVGGFAVSFAAPHAFDADERAFLLSIVEQGALALERAQFLEQRLRVDAEMRASERRFRAVFDHSVDAMVIIDDQRAFVDLNRAACRLLRTPREALLGRSSADVIAETPSHESGSLWSSFRSDGQQRGEVRLRRADGTTVDVEYSAAADILPGRHLAVWRDIEERKRASDNLRFLADASCALGSTVDAECALASVVRLAVPTVADWAALDMLDDDGSIRRVHAEHSDRAKLELERELHQKFAPRLTDERGAGHVIRTGSSELMSDLEDALSAQEASDPARVAAARALGLSSWICVPISLRGRTMGAISFVNAESQRRFSRGDLTICEEVARRASIAIDNTRALREAQEANRLKDEFLSTVSHELRTPLTAILGWATLLLRGASPGAVAKSDVLRRGLETIERNARAQGRLIEDVLDVARIISGKLRLQLGVVDLAAVVAAAVDVVTPAAEAKRVRLVAEMGEPQPVFGDADRLQQVVWNLLSNAVKFTPSGGRVDVHLHARGGQVELCVSDTGQGIQPDVLPYIFDRFRQADSSASRQHGGLGLGLAIARHLVELHGGEVSAQSHGQGRGATFRLRLPLRTTAPMVDGDPVDDVPVAAVSGVRLDGVRVLVCEDDEDTRELIRVMLHGAGAEVRAVAGAAEALESMAAFAPRVLLSDVGMPGEDGYSLVRRVRELPPERGGRVPAVALTAYARAEDAGEASRAGFDVHLAKPVRERELLEVVARLAASTR
jgi:PAS domain S-box-containing protein